MRRELVWIEEQRFRGWGCSECAWAFNPSGTPTGKSLEEMKQNYEQQRAKDFAAHVCQQAGLLATKTEQLARSEGRREGMEAHEDKK
jgi:hypothetical protein